MQNARIKIIYRNLLIELHAPGDELPCKQRSLSSMAFSVYEVVRVACPSRSWFVLYTPEETSVASRLRFRDYQTK